MDKKRHKRRLLEEKKNIENQLSKFARKNKQDEGDYISKFPNYGKEEQDNAEEVGEYSTTLSLERQLETELKKINKALKKIKNKEVFGICEACGKQIEEKRLNAKPQSLRCINCAKERDRES